MVISLPRLIATRREVESEKVVEVKLPELAEKVKENKLFSAFRVVLGSPLN